MTERLVGRQAEERAVIDFLDSLPGRSCALVIEGEAGIGKTTVWADAVHRAGECGYRVLSCRAAAAESVLAYTVLADLLDDVDDSVWADLPAPQQQALDGALLRDLVEASEIDPRAVAAANARSSGRSRRCWAPSRSLAPPWSWRCSEASQSVRRPTRPRRRHRADPRRDPRGEGAAPPAPRERPRGRRPAPGRPDRGDARPRPLRLPDAPAGGRVVP